MSTTAANVVSTQDTKTALDTTTLAASEKRRPQKLSDFPEDVQALMPEDWDKTKNISDFVPIGPCNSWNEKNYFIFAILFHPELASRMIVCDVDPNVQKGELCKNSPFWAAINGLYGHGNPTLVESLCMAGAILIRPFGLEGTATCEWLADQRSFIGNLYEKSKKNILSAAEQALLFHVYFATATKQVNAQLASVNKVMPRDVFQIVFSYFCSRDTALEAHLTVANVQFENREITHTSLVEPFHTLARQYFEKPLATLPTGNNAASQQPLLFSTTSTASAAASAPKQRKASVKTTPF